MHTMFTTIIRKRVLVIGLFLLLAIFGYLSWSQLSIEAYPDIADVTSQVVTQVPGLAAEEVEQQITIPLERALNGIPGLHVMRSRSTFGLSMITLVFEDGIDDYWARQRINERIAEVELPYDAHPGMDPLTSPVGEIYRYIVEGHDDLRELTEAQRWIVIPRLKQVPGVADVTNFGGITTQFQLELDPMKMEQYGTSLSAVTDAIDRNNANVGGSVLDRGELGYVVRGIGLLSSLDDIGRIIVTSKAGVPILLRDLGTLKYGNVERKGILSYTDHTVDHSESIEGIVLLLKHENPSKVLEGIHAAVAELNGGMLPPGMRVRAFLDRTDLVDTTLHTVSRTLLEGIGLVIVVLILFIGDWRGAALVAVTIPLSLLTAFILMHLTGVPANLLSLGAIDFGIIVDGAIVMMEVILRRREDAATDLHESSIAAVAGSMARPIFFSTIIIITAYLPLFAFERVERKLFTPMAFTVSFALIGALLVALLLIPGLSFIAYRKARPIRKNRWLERLTAGYEATIDRLLRKPRIVVGILCGALALGIVFTMLVGKEYLPPLDEGTIWLQVQLPPGITLERSREMADSLRAVTMKHDEVTYMMIQAGRNDDGTDPWTPSHYECSIGLLPYAQWTSGMTKADLIDRLSHDYARMPGYTIAFSQPMIDGVMDKISGAHSELVVKIYGHDMDETRRIAEKVHTELSHIQGAVDVAIDQDPPLPQLRIVVDRDAAARYGLNVSEIGELIEVAIGGKSVAQIHVGSKVYDITCRYRPDSRSSPDRIGALLLTTVDGMKVPLAQVASISMNTGASTITREMNKRHLTVRLNLRGRDLSSFLAEARQRIEHDVHYDHGRVAISWGGQFENQRRAYTRLAIIVPVALAIMFLLLYSAFGTVRHAALILIIIPLALFGGMLAIYLRGMTLNVSSAVGFIALFGVAIQNGVLMISQFRKGQKEGLSVREAVVRGAAERFRPILMTSTVAICGLMPASLATGIGSDVQRPLATVIVYGLFSATAMTLFVLPTLYLMVERRLEKTS